jgi:hypothetical protein
MQHHHSIAIGGLALGLAIVLTPGAAHAYFQSRVLIANPVSYCQAALPVFDGNIRKRPLALRNEGQGSAFVTCSFTAEGGTSSSLHYVRLRVSGSPFRGQDDIGCTGVTSAAGYDNQYVTKTFSPSVLDTNTVFEWVPDDFDFEFDFIPGGGLFSVSCQLPPGAAILDSEIMFYTWIGEEE